MPASRPATPAASHEPRVVLSAGAESAPVEYQIIRRIGEGGMGVVFEAKQISLGRPVRASASKIRLNL